MANYLVNVRDGSGELHNILCNDRGELSSLLNHLDSDEYEIVNIEVLNNVSSDIKQFCKKENLETGGKPK